MESNHIGDKVYRIPENLDIEVLMLVHPPSFNGFKIQKVYHVCDVIYRGMTKFDPITGRYGDQKRQGSIPLHTDMLRHFLGGNFRDILNWMILVGIIECDNQYEKGLVSMGYKFTTDFEVPFVKKECVDYTMNRRKAYQHDRFDGYDGKKKTLKNLQKWLSGLQVNADYADYCIEHEYYDSIEAAESDEEVRNIQRRRLAQKSIIDAFDESKRDFSRDTFGRRFHSVLTNLSKKYRGLISFDGDSLAQTDISNSQFYFALRLLQPDTWKRSNSFWEDVSIDNTIMFHKTAEMVASGGFQIEKFIRLVCRGKFYEFMLNEMDTTGIYFNETLSYEEKRDHIKAQLIRLLFAAPNGEGVTDYRKAWGLASVYKGPNKLLWECLHDNFPQVFSLLEVIRKNDYHNTSKLFQRLESSAVLDYCINKISDVFPEMPLFTIHDCVVTTESKIYQLDMAFRKYLSEIVGYSPCTSITEWWTYREGLPEDPAMLFWE